MVSKEELIEKNLGKNLEQGCTTTCSVDISAAEFKCRNPKLECPNLSPGDSSGHFKFYAEIGGIEKAKATITVRADGEKIGGNSKTFDVGGTWWDPLNLWGMCGASGPFAPRCRMDVSFNREVKPGEKIEATLSWTKA